MPGDPMIELSCTMLHWDFIELFLYGTRIYNVRHCVDMWGWLWPVWLRETDAELNGRTPFSRSFGSIKVYWPKVDLKFSRGQNG